MPEVHATILPISFNPATAPIGTGATVSFATAGGPVLTVWGTNASTGKTIFGGNHLDDITTVGVGQLLLPSTLNAGWTIYAGPSASGTAYFGFKTRAGNVGWFQLDWGGPGGALKYLKGAYANAGESIVVGQFGTAAIPEPSELGLLALGLLALGAAGLRRRREALVEVNKLH